MVNISSTQDVQSQLTYGQVASYRHREVGETARLAKQHRKFANARQLVLHNIDVSLQAVLNLKTNLNTLTAIGRLPDNIIAKILVTFVHELYYSKSARRDYACFHRHPPPRWLKLTHVCRHWRNVALHTTRLWSHVYLTRSDAFALFVERAKASPLDIDVRHNVRNDIRGGVSILDLIPPVSSRIRSLSVDDQIPTVQAFCKQLTRPLEQLEKLVLASRFPLFGFSGPQEAVPFVATGGLTPRLSYLELDRLPFHWTDPAFRVTSLTTLKVTAPAWKPNFWNRTRPDIGTTADLLDVLERIAPRLEVLELDNAIPTPSNQSPGPPSLPPSLSFPSLRSVRLCGPTHDCADLLSCFSMNPEAGIHLVGSGSRGMGNLIGHLSAHLSARPLVAVRLGSPYGSFNIDIYGWQTTDTSWDNAPVRLAFSKLHGDGEEDATRKFVRESLALFSHVGSLRVDNGIPYRLTWRDLFALTPRLRTLAFNSHPFDRTLQSGQSLVPLPELRAVHFNEVLFRYPGDNMPREFIDDMLAWVALRREHGVPLETLGLMEFQHSEEGDIEGLRRVVPNVVWDGSG